MLQVYGETETLKNMRFCYKNHKSRTFLVSKKSGLGIQNNFYEYLTIILMVEVSLLQKNILKNPDSFRDMAPTFKERS